MEGSKEKNIFISITQVEENGRLWVNIAKRQLITYGADALMADEMVDKCKNIGE